MKELFPVSLTISFVVAVVFVLTQRLTRHGHNILGLSHGFAIRTIGVSLISCASVSALLRTVQGSSTSQLPDFLAATLFFVAAVSIAVIPTLLVAELVVLVELCLRPQYRAPRLIASHAVAAAACATWLGLVVVG